MNRPAPNIHAPPSSPVQPVRTTEPLPTAVGDKVRFWVPGSKTDGLTGTVKSLVAMGMAFVTMDNGSSERYIPIKYLVKLTG